MIEIICAMFMMGFALLYPAYLSFKAIKSNNSMDLINLMTYWVVLALFQTFQPLGDTLFSTWMPFYYELKMLWVIWLLSSTTRGSVLLYTNFIHPVLSTHENEIENTMQHMRKKACNWSLYISSKFIQILVNAFHEANLRSSDSFFLRMAGGGDTAELTHQEPLASEFQDDETKKMNIELIEEEI